MISFTEEEVTAEAVDVGEKLYEVLVQELPEPTQRSLMIAIQSLAIAAGAVIVQAMEQAHNPIKLRRLLLEFLVAHAKKVANMPPESATKH